jgi:hypothetical protein
MLLSSESPDGKFLAPMKASQEKYCRKSANSETMRTNLAYSLFLHRLAPACGFTQAVPMLGGFFQTQ